MKLIQLNIWEGKLLKEILNFIDNEKPDILCMQEVFSCRDYIYVPDMMFNSLEQISEELGYEYSFFSPVFTSVYAEVPADFGNAIVSKYPLSECAAEFTNGDYNPNLTSQNAARNTRLLQTCTVSVGGKKFSLANHHGHHEFNPVGNGKSVEKMQLVKEKIERLPAPLIFAGDLNVTGASPAMRVFDGFLESLTAKHGVNSTLSQLGKVSGVACDHILVGPGVKVKDFRVSEELVSDHKALILEFEV